MIGTASLYGLAAFFVYAANHGSVRMIQSQAPAPQENVPLPPTSDGRARRSYFWPGFALGFALLALASCSGIAIALGLNQLSLAEIQGNGVVWTPPPYTPAPTPLPAAEAVESQSVSARFAPEQAVRNLTNSRVNVRSTPGYLSKPDGDVIGVLPPAGTAIILGESQLADNLVWWRVRAALADGRAIDGWVAEATASGVQILGQ